ncbi:uncharacterized protein LOC113962535 [Neopelma chrysocephalum]|uniref:uncharacterized protein LOC113962535 n=1 Tax=Neopelma chrysocephalum TaxID=114329 RepID=UPI000FCD4D9E|nr:uncharacterized protein LOC113962535 [Neopelma chrysocephalum]
MEMPTGKAEPNSNPAQGMPSPWFQEGWGTVEEEEEEEWGACSPRELCQGERGRAPLLSQGLCQGKANGYKDLSQWSELIDREMSQMEEFIEQQPCPRKARRHQELCQGQGNGHKELSQWEELINQEMSQMEEYIDQQLCQGKAKRHQELCQGQVSGYKELSQWEELINQEMSQMEDFIDQELCQGRAKRHQETARAVPRTSQETPGVVPGGGQCTQRSLPATRK